ncbi:hypothetical protein [Moraxella lacunata]|uniref:hypothetical protein n=1 Tax=Moraxella lacunata TaxID=477 RepID=UPI003EE38BE3
MYLWWIFVIMGRFCKNTLFQFELMPTPRPYQLIITYSQIDALAVLIIGVTHAFCKGQRKRTC